MDPQGPTSTTPPATFRVSFTESSGRRGVRVPALLVHLVALLFFLGLLAVGLIVFIPLAIVAGLVFLVTLGVVWVRVRFARARQPNGALDGRRNVRVRR